MRRYGESVQRGRQYKVRPGAYAILARGDEVLLTFQEAPEPEFQLPGGGIDPGESPLVALHREVFEETGWRVSRPRKLGAYRRFTFMPEYEMWAEKVCSVYVARPSVRIAEPQEAGHTAVWTHPDDAIELVASDGDRAMLRMFVRFGL